MTYVNYFIDLEDVKFYESEKAALLVSVLIMRTISSQGNPMSVSEFDDGMYCGLVRGQKLKISGETTPVWWTADVWHSNNKEGAFYTITYCNKNSSDITDNQMICKLVNSLEF